MGADGDRHVTLIGLEVTDDAGYARYRNATTPILARHGGAFGSDFVAAQMLKGPNPRINRVFTLTFPSCANRKRLFADEEYRSVRARWFEPAVGAVEVLAETSPDVARPTWLVVSDEGVVASMSPSPRPAPRRSALAMDSRCRCCWRPWRARVFPSCRLPALAAAAWRHGCPEAR